MTRRRWLIVLGLVWLLPAQAWAQAGPQARVAQVLRAPGKVEVRRGAAETWTLLRPGGELRRGDSVRTFEASFAHLNFDVGGEWQLRALSELDLTPAVTDGPGEIRVRLARGGVVAKWRPEPRAGQTARLTIVTPGGLAGIVGTEWSIRVDEDGKTTLLVLEGRVDLRNDLDQSLSVNANQAAEMAVGRPPVLLRLLNPEDRVQWVAAYQPNPARYAAGGDAAANAELIQADALIAADDFAAARARIDAGKMRFPTDARFDALLSRLTLFEGESVASREAADAAVAKDPKAVEGWLALGDWGIREGDLFAARRGFTEAGSVAPQDARAWFGLGHVASDREEFPSATRFLGTALRLDPDGPGYRGQLGLTYTLANQLRAAAREYAAALEQQPDDYVSLTGRALLALKQGRENEAIELLQRVTLFAPRYARAHMYLGVAYYRQRRVEAAIRELERASRLDPRDPLPYMMLTQIHTDLYEPWKAIGAAREAQVRMPYLKSFNQLSNTVKGGANLGNAMAFFGLDEWAEHLAHESYDPFWAGSHLFLGDRYTTPFARESEYQQGLLSDPTVFGGSPRFQPLLARPATHAVATAFTADYRGIRGNTHDVSATLNGFSNQVVPVSYLLTASRGSINAVGDPRGTLTPTRATGAIGATVRAGWSLLATGQVDKVEARTDGGEVIDTFSDALTRTVGLSLMRRFSPQSMVWVRGSVSRNRVDAGGELMGFPLTGFRVQANLNEVQLRYTVRFAGWNELSSGVELARLTVPISLTFIPTGHRSELLGYASHRADVGPRLTTQVGVVGTRHYETQLTGDPIRRVYLSPRAGAVVRLRTNLVARLAYQDLSRAQMASATLAPMATAGLPSDDEFLVTGGRFRARQAAIAWQPASRWFAHVSLDRASIRPEMSYFSAFEMVMGVTAVSTDVADRLRQGAGEGTRADTDSQGNKGSGLGALLLSVLSGQPTYRLWRTAASMNWIAADQLSLAVTHRRSDGTATVVPPVRQSVDMTAVTATWVHPRQLSVRGAVSWGRPSLPVVFRHLGRLDPEWNSSLRGTWESPSKRWAAETGIANGFSNAFPLAWFASFTLRQ